MRRVVVTLPGDGIGRQVLPEALRVLRAVGFQADYVEAPIGWDCWLQTGNPLPKATLELLREHRLGLFGAASSAPAAEAEAALPSRLQGQGLRYSSPVLGLRRQLGLELAVRPCRSLPGLLGNFVRRTAQGGIEEPHIDAVVCLQNTEGHYAGVEWRGIPAGLRSALEAHEHMQAFASSPADELALSCRVQSLTGCRRAARRCFAWATAHGYQRVTICDKWGVMDACAGLLLQAAEEVAREFPNLQCERVLADALLLRVSRRPDAVSVVLCPALIGDLLSDLLAGLSGGIGFAACANLGPECAVFEPVHGSAPHYARLAPAIVNPCAAILAGALLLEHVGETTRARRVREAVARVVRAGHVRSFDMAGLPGGADVLGFGVASTSQVGDAIIAALQEDGRRCLV